MKHIITSLNSRTQQRKEGYKNHVPFAVGSELLLFHFHREGIIVVRSGTEYTYVDELLDVADLEVMEDGGVVEVGESGHVLAHVELGRVHLGHLILFELLHLQFPMVKMGEN